MEVSTVLERDHFYSDFLFSLVTVLTNFFLSDDEARGWEETERVFAPAKRVTQHR